MSRPRGRRPKKTLPSTSRNRTPKPVQEQEQQKPRRLRSRAVILGSVGTLVACLCGCGVIADRDRTCVDSSNRAVDARRCEDGTSGTRWYYGGGRGGDGKMTGGSFERGGFGGHGGGGS